MWKEPNKINIQRGSCTSETTRDFRFMSQNQSVLFYDQTNLKRKTGLSQWHFISIKYNYTVCLFFTTCNKITTAKTPDLFEFFFTSKSVLK